MVTAAKEGKFKVSEEAGEALKQAIADYVTDWSYNQIRFQRLAEQPKLGTGPFAQQVGHHAALVADGDEMSAKTQLDALRDVLNRAEEAIDLATSKYLQREADNAGQLKSLQKD
jgi:phosphatidylserine/phosphatidylglycerophosphate/cardiolipin synthase-like enzyme